MAEQEGVVVEENEVEAALGRVRLPIEWPTAGTILSRIYVVADRSTIAQFLDAHPFLVPLLIEVRRELLAYFPHASVVLEVFTDPEFGEESKLVAAINPTVPPDEAIKQYRRFQHAWWISATQRAQGKLAVTLEYR